MVTHALTVLMLAIPWLPGADWNARAAQNVCGLTDLSQVTRPARVDHGALMTSTPEVRQMQRQRIGRNTPMGEILHNKAVDRVRAACSQVMRAGSYCSVWKEITRSGSGGKVDDLTPIVIEMLGRGNAEATGPPV